MSGKARLRDVAERAGVSEATVSRVVNGKSGVAEPTRQAVLKVLRELGYEPAGLGRPTGVGAVGVVLPELDNPTFPLYAQAIEARVARAGLATIVCTATLTGTAESVYIDLLLDRGVSGLVFVSGLHADTTADHSRYCQLHEQGVPFVCVNGALVDLDVPAVSADERTAGCEAVEHLLALGHRRIGLAVGPERYQPVIRRLEGYRHTLADAGCAEFVRAGDFSVEGGHAAAMGLLEVGVTAIVAASDLMALGAVRAVRQRGLCVPEDVSVVGYDDTPLMAYTDPPLTTFRQPIRAIGTAAAGALLTEIDGPGRAPRGEHLFRAELVTRRSTALAPELARPASEPSGAVAAADSA